LKTFVLNPNVSLPPKTTNVLTLSIENEQLSLAAGGDPVISKLSQFLESFQDAASANRLMLLHSTKSVNPQVAAGFFA
jgi:hypothetical protein